MYRHYLIVASEKNIAAMNIVNNLQQFRQSPVPLSMDNGAVLDIYLTKEEVLYEENLDMEKISQYDFVIFPCTHKSEKGEKSLSIHAPGNWRDAQLGGKIGRVSPSSALFQKALFEKLKENMDQYELEKKFKLTLEATHHGPLINKPCVFIEIGSSETEWKDRRAGFIIAKTIFETINEFKKNDYREIAIGIGGPHYCPNFNNIQLNSNIAISHIIPSYVAPISEDMIKEAINKTEEELDFAVIDWKGLGTSEQRQYVLDILDKHYIAWKKTSDISKN
jgi:D-aminoacyl-tRNA deacylase